MNSEFNQLLQIRKQKESKQRQIIQELTQNLEVKKPMLENLEQSMALFKTQKATIENVFFDQISGQQMKPESIAEYQNKVKTITQFDADLNSQYQEIVNDIDATETKLAQARQDLVNAEQDVEKIALLVESEQRSSAIKQTKAEDSKADDQATESWSRSS